MKSSTETSPAASHTLLFPLTRLRLLQLVAHLKTFRFDSVRSACRSGTSSLCLSLGATRQAYLDHKQTRSRQSHRCSTPNMHTHIQTETYTTSICPQALWETASPSGCHRMQSLSFFFLFLLLYEHNNIRIRVLWRFQRSVN